MNLLGFDLSSRQGSLALVSGNDVTVSREWANDRRNSAPFFQFLNETISQYSAPDIILVGLGPGSYTGTRIAISTAIGLRLTTGASLVGIPSIVGLSAKEDYAAIGDAKRSSFFFARVRCGRVEATPELITGEEMAARLRSAPLPFYTSDDLPQFSAATLRFPSAESLCRRAIESPQNVVRGPLAPIYLREPHITKPRRA